MLMSLNQEQSEYYLRMVEKDSDFLKRHGIMDYSLLLIIEHFNQSIENSSLNDDTTHDDWYHKSDFYDNGNLVNKSVSCLNNTLFSRKINVNTEN